MTNGERIRSMTDEEWADKLVVLFVCARCPIRKFCDENDSSPTATCIRIWKRWLKSEVKND